MQSITYTSLRKTLSSVLDEVEKHNITYHITRKNHCNIVIMTEEDYNSLHETLYLLSNPINAKKIKQSIKQAQTGQFKTIDLNEKS